MLSLLAVLAMVLTRSTVGLATLGPFVAFYTAVSIGSARSARTAVTVLAAALLLTGLLRPVDLSAEGALVTLLAFFAALVLATGARTRRGAARAAVLAAQQRAELERERAESERDRAASSAAQERLRITRELHDVLGHALSVVVVQASVAERFLQTRPEQARTAVQEIADTGRRSLAEIRQLLGVLRDGETEPAPQALPGLQDLPALVEQVASAGLPVTLDVVTLDATGRPTTSATSGPVGLPVGLPVGVDLAAYRLVQEALTNCLRHAGASRAVVTITHHPTAVEADVVDDGRRGVQVPGAEQSLTRTPGHGLTRAPGHGLTGMRERVAIYGGDLSVGPLEGSGAGFRVHARFPTTAPVAQVPT